MLSKLYNNRLFPYLAIAIVAIVSTFILWLPFILRVNNINGLKVTGLNFYSVAKNWDGPLYIIPAKTLYNKNDPIFKDLILSLSAKYFAAHLPGYPITLKVIAPFVGYPRATLYSTLLFSIAFFMFFYYFLVKLKLTQEPLILTLVLMFITPRFFVVRSIGSPETMFMFFTLLSIYFFSNKKYLFASLAGAVAVITKSPGILLFASYALYFLVDLHKTHKFKISSLSILLIPLSLLGVFYLYQVQMGDFWAYFKSGDNLHLVFPPFSVFNSQKAWVGTGWLEEIIFLYFFYIVATLKTWEEKTLPRIFSYFMLVFFISIIFVQHRDISRYALPMLPFAAISYEKFFTNKKFLIALIIIIPAIYLYAWNFMLFNSAPITEWGPFI